MAAFKIPRRLKKDPKVLIAILIINILFLIFFSDSQNDTKPQTLGSDIQQAKVIEVIDGDTIKLETGETVRYIGIDTPETKFPGREKECFGDEAYQYNKDLVENKIVKLVKDKSETDRYGRLLRYVYVEDVFVNQNLAEQGYAKATSYPPDISMDIEFENAESNARQNSRGLWKSCSE